MPEANNASAVVRAERTLNAGPREVFKAFERPDLLARWWGPNGFTNTFERFEFTPGGRWLHVMHGPDGANYDNESVFREIVPDARIVLAHISPPRFTLTVTLTARAEQTHIAWVQEFESAELAARMRPICEPGNEQNLDRLEALLAGAGSTPDTGERKSLMRAVRARDAASVQTMIAANPALLSATDPDCFGSTPLLHAVGADDSAMVDLLLDLGADINQRSDWWAGSFGVLDSAGDDLAERLLARGAALTPHAAARLGKIDDLRAMLSADPSLVHARGGDGQTPLHFARTPEIADLLLAKGADISALDIDHHSAPAQWLATSRPQVAAHLASRGAAADPFLAARIGDVPLLERLLRTEPHGVMVRVSRDRFPAPPPAAGHIYLFTIGEGCTLLHAAVGADQCAVIRWLAAHGADVNARGGYDDSTPLHAAAWGDHTDAAHALLDAGADINAPSGRIHDNEPIGWAIVGGAVAAFRALRERGGVVRRTHIEDARKGAAGAFRELNPKRPLDAWQEIERALTNP